MHNNKILWSSCVAIIVILATTPTIARAGHDDQGMSPTDTGSQATTNTGGTTETQFDSSTGELSGGVLTNPVEIITNSGTGAGSGAGEGLGADSGTGGGLGTGGELGSSSGGGSGTTSTLGDSGTGTGDGVVASDGGEGGNRNTALGKGECATIACLSAKDGPQKLTLNDAAQLLEDNLDASYDTLVAAQEKTQENLIATRRNVLDENVRRIVRNSDRCPSPDRPAIQALKLEDEAREIVQKQLTESQKFIEQVNLHIEQIDPEQNIW